MLVLNFSGNTLLYSVAHCSKGLLPGKDVISTNLRDMKLSRKVLDKFLFDDARPPSEAGVIFKIPLQSESPGTLSLFIGHADDSGPERHNISLALERARNSAAFLVDQGTPKNQIIIVSVGSNIPAYKVPGPENKAFDRRVEKFLVPDPFTIRTNSVESVPFKKR